MRNIFLKLLKSEKGSVIALVAIGFTALMGAVAMVSDVGLLYLKQNKLAHAMDAAALAGAQELPANPDYAVAIARQYAQMNGLQPERVSVVVSDNNTTLTVNTTMDINLIFARYFGREDSTVNAQAKARVAPAKAVNGAVPFSVMDQTLQYGQEYVLKEGAGNSSWDGARMSGWFGALDFTGGGGGANEYRDMVREGYSGQIAVGDIIDIESGNMSGPTMDGVTARVNACNHQPRCTWDSFNPDCKRLIYLPIVQQVNSRNVRVLGFAAFFLKGVEGNGNDSRVTGFFVRETISAEIDGTLVNYGLQGVKLTN